VLDLDRVADDEAHQILPNDERPVVRRSRFCNDIVDRRAYTFGIRQQR
jgi:hypothetical protein